jgi:hypothetical protein
MRNFRIRYQYCIEKRDDEGIKRISEQQTEYKNSQYTNFNLNYHKNLPRLYRGYSDGFYVQKNETTDTRYNNNKVSHYSMENEMKNESPSLFTLQNLKLMIRTISDLYCRILSEPEASLAE